MQGKTVKTRLDNGFTLVEIAVVMVIFGLLLTSALQLYRVNMMDYEYNITRQNMTLVQDAIREYYGLKGRFPCPADPTLVPGDADYGLEKCTDQLPDPCLGEISCQTTGARDADGDTVDDLVLIGAVPIMTLVDNSDRLVPIEELHGKDGFGMKLSYAVTDNMTRGTIEDPANPNLGAINVQDENGQDMTETPASALFVVISHGQNKVGATPRASNAVVEDCTFPAAAIPGDPPPAGFNPGAAGIKVDRENCDLNDAFFVSGLRTLADTDDYYDDVIYITANVNNPIWQKSLHSPAGQTWTNNTNLGFVGVGTNTPAEPLHATGNIRAEDSAVADNGFCDYLGEQDPAGIDPLLPDECLQPSFIADTAAAVGPKKCPAGQIATGIQENKLVCRDLFTGPITFNCSAGQFVTSFTIDSTGNLVGTPICASP